MVPPLLVDGSPHLPFQLQIEYTGQDGSRCIRVITQAKPITTNRDVAERGRVGGYNYYMHYMYVMYIIHKQKAANATTCTCYPGPAHQLLDLLLLGVTLSSCG